MTMMTVPGISAAEEHYLHEGAREFFERQGIAVLAEFLRREGANPLTEDFGALAAPDAGRKPARRANYTTNQNPNDPHFMW